MNFQEVGETTNSIISLSLISVLHYRKICEVLTVKCHYAVFRECLVKIGGKGGSGYVHLLLFSST